MYGQRSKRAVLDERLNFYNNFLSPAVSGFGVILHLPALAGACYLYFSIVIIKAKSRLKTFGI